MKNRRILIYLEEDKLKPAGGPYAVGYYIFKRLQELGRFDIEFLPGGATIQGEKQIKSQTKFLNRLKPFVHAIKRIKRYKRMIDHGGYSPVDLNKYDVVHFHTTRSMFECRLSLENYRGTVILTSHSPVPLAKELYDEQLSNFEKKYFKGLYSRLPEMDEYAFNRADIIQFPCLEAEEPYYNNWESYRLIHENNTSKYRYIPTGIPYSGPKREPSAVFKELELNEETDFLISYMGRHNFVKGYDQLKKIGLELFKEYDDVHFVIGGVESPLKGLDNANWHELGWTSDAHSYIAASDIFVLPNLETYFDIIMLEVLSLGKVVVASRTGGNKYFQKYSDSGIFLYDTIDEAIEIIKNLKGRSKNEIWDLGQKNRKIYEENFTDKIFVDNYLALLNNITNK